MEVLGLLGLMLLWIIPGIATLVLGDYCCWWFDDCKFIFNGWMWGKHSNFKNDGDTIAMSVMFWPVYLGFILWKIGRHLWFDEYIKKYHDFMSGGR